MSITRRSFIGGTAVASAFTISTAAARAARLKIGVTDWNLRQGGRLEAVALAKKLGFEGVEVSLGRKIVGDKLPLDNSDLQQQYIAEARKHGIRIAGTCLDVLHVNCLKNDKLGARWLAEGIPITRKLDAKVMLLPFFGRGALETRQEMDYVADVLKEIGREAEKAKVRLGLENTISAEDNARILDRAASRSVSVYYDVGNSTRAGFDPVKEIRWLGRKRICQMHLKDNPQYLGEGTIDFPAVFKAIDEIDFSGFANLETDSPSKSIEADMKRNLTFVRRMLAARS